MKQKAFDQNLAAVFDRKARVEPARKESEESKWGVSSLEVCAFHIFQYAVADMEFELLLQRFIGIVAMGVSTYEQLGKVLEFGDVFFRIDFAGNEVVEEVSFFVVCKVGIEPVEHL